jgi:hypothetical protein
VGPTDSWGRRDPDRPVPRAGAPEYGEVNGAGVPEAIHRVSRPGDRPDFRRHFNGIDQTTRSITSEFDYRIRVIVSFATGSVQP